MNELKDSTLIEIRNERGLLKFILIVMVIFFFFTTIWYLCSFNFVKYKEPLTYTTTEINFHKLVRELNRSYPKVVIVGTSVADRLIADLFSFPGVTNLAVPGGSTLTGLEILVNQKIFPKLLYIETDYVRIHPDLTLISFFNTPNSNLKQILQGLIKPLRYVTNIPYFSYMKNDINVEEVKQKILSKPPDNSIDESGFEKGANAYHATDAIKKSKDYYINISRIKTLTNYFESHGTKVFYIHIPLSQPYEKSQDFIDNRVAISGNESYECSRCLDLNDMENLNELRWGDGVHLDYRSLLLTIDELEKHIRKNINVK